MKHEIIERNIDELKPYSKNTKKHPAEQIKRLAQSIKKFGFIQPVIIDEEDSIVCGHGRVLGAKKARLKKVPTIMLSDLTDEEIRDYRIADNKLNESPWDEIMLDQELLELQDSLSRELFEYDIAEAIEEDETKYAMKTNIPQYEIKGDEPDIEELYEVSKVNELLRRIKDSNVTDEEKKFLRLGAYRHLRFNYAKIAEYYAHATKEMQELMEDSAMVIIDFEDAIAKGYVHLSETVALMREEGEQEE